MRVCSPNEGRLLEGVSLMRVGVERCSPNEVYEGYMRARGIYDV